jgi:hypothetical protein
LEIRLWGAPGTLYKKQSGMCLHKQTTAHMSSVAFNSEKRQSRTDDRNHLNTSADKEVVYEHGIQQSASSDTRGCVSCHKSRGGVDVLYVHRTRRSHWAVWGRFRSTAPFRARKSFLTRVFDVHMHQAYSAGACGKKYWIKKTQLEPQSHRKCIIPAWSGTL